MSIKPVIQAKTAQVLEKEALHYGVTATAMAKAILDAAVHQGLIHTLLVGVDVESYQIRKRGRPVIKGARR
ncbi:MAG: hypothetical protein JWQ74_3538 [Marmoricola sp.]|nr:hypothetical protein [Marmoricola sp.]